jgi:hypothetical protein
MRKLFVAVSSAIAVVSASSLVTNDVLRSRRYCRGRPEQRGGKNRLLVVAPVGPDGLQRARLGWAACGRCAARRRWSKILLRAPTLLPSPLVIAAQTRFSIASRVDCLMRALRGADQRSAPARGRAPARAHQSMDGKGSYRTRQADLPHPAGTRIRTRFV